MEGGSISEKDDLISLFYTLVFLSENTLPWFDQKYLTMSNVRKNIELKKQFENLDMMFELYPNVSFLRPFHELLTRFNSDKVNY